jgi:predicted metal-dependent hydrolase
MRYDPLFIQFLYHFNIDRDYYECHEVMEELWMEENRNLLFQGLLQVAVGLFHARNNNTNGAIKSFSQALRKLELYPEHQLGIDMEQLLQEIRQYRIRLQCYDPAGSPFDFYDLTIIIDDNQLAIDLRSYIVTTHKE